MNTNLNLLVLKLSDDHKHSKRDIKTRSKGKWKMSPKKLEELNDVDYVVVLNKMNVIAVYTLGNTYTYDREIHRVGELQLTETNDLDIIGRQVDYKTGYPATITTYDSVFN